MKNTTQHNKIILQRFFHFCPHCGLRLKKQKIHDSPELLCPACGFVFWQNPKPTASCLLVTRSRKILLAKRGVEPFKGLWDVPGGFLEYGEHPEDGVRREIREELGLRLPRRLELIGVYMDTYGKRVPESTLNFYFLATIPKTKKLVAQDDITDVSWFSLKQLPSIAFLNGRRAVRDLKKKIGL